MATYRQRDVVMIHVPLTPRQGSEKHPVIILSCNELVDYEEWFTGVMITGSIKDDEYAFELSDAMFERPLVKRSEARVHIVSSFSTEVIAGAPVNRMKAAPFQRLIGTIVSANFGLSASL